MGKIVTPYLPADAQREARSWMASGKPAFIKAPERNWVEDGCPNCGGVGCVYVVFAARGPLHSPPASEVGTYFDGDGQYGKGWYVVDRTMGYTCPECKGIPRHTGRYVLPPKEVPESITQLAKLFGKKEQLRR